MQRDRAVEIFDFLSAYIERHTASVCPTCESVCCIDRHGTYDEDDAAFLGILGIEPLRKEKKTDDTEPCRFLTHFGCGVPRLRRPFRCTWYFCSPLLDEISKDRPREYRRFVAGLQELIALRQEVISRGLRAGAS